MVGILDRHLHPPGAKVVVGEVVGLAEDELLIPLHLVGVVDMDDATLGRDALGQVEGEDDAPQLGATNLLGRTVIDGGVAPVVALLVGETVHSLKVASSTGEVLPAITGVAVHAIGANATIETRIRIALVDLLLALIADVAGQAVAGVVVHPVDAGPAIEAGVRVAVIDRHHHGVDRSRSVHLDRVGRDGGVLHHGGILRASIGHVGILRDVGILHRGIGGNVGILRRLVSILRRDVSVGRLVRVILHQSVRRHRSIGGDERVLDDHRVRRHRVGVGQDDGVRLRHGVGRDERVVGQRVRRRRMGVVGLENIRRRRRITLPKAKLTGSELENDEDGRDDQNELRHDALQAWSK